jgi:hypothetical protein
MKYLITSLLLLFSLPSEVYSQNNGVIEGRVLDADTGEPLHGVNVFLAETFLGRSTNAEGDYKIENIPDGVYEVIFSYIGYETQIHRFQFNEARRNVRQDVRMKMQPLSDGELTVTAQSQTQWEQDYEIFKIQFLGRSESAGNIMIVNPEVLEFFENQDNKNLIAKASGPIHVVNYTLGYEIFIELRDFEWGRYEDYGVMLYYPQFKLMEPENRRQERQWERSRRAAYEGSFRHFLKSMYDGDARRRHFNFEYGNLLPLSNEELRYELVVRRAYPAQLASFVKGFRIIREMNVTYGRQDSSYDMGIMKRSILKGTGPHDDGIIFVDPNGNLLDPLTVRLFGEWGGERLATMLPLGYRP